LIEQGANVNKENKKGATPIFNACLGGHEAVVQYLVEHGADLNKQSQDGSTPFVCALSSRNENIVSYLIEKLNHL